MIIEQKEILREFRLRLEDALIEGKDISPEVFKILREVEDLYDSIESKNR